MSACLLYLGGGYCPANRLAAGYGVRGRRRVCKQPPPPPPPADRLGQHDPTRQIVLFNACRTPCRVQPVQPPVCAACLWNRAQQAPL